MRRMQIFALLSALAVAESYTLPRAVQRVRAPAQTARHPDATPEEYEIVYGEGACVGAGIDERLYAINENLINVVKGCVDLAYEGRDYARFYVLEVLARVPYFSYLTVLHFRETFGARDADHVARTRVHFSEADNELHHLLIVEALGGNASAVDRALAQTLAFGYYWYVCACYAANPRLAYHLSELIEDHAYHTYDAFLRDHGDALRAEPAPAVATAYYGAAPFGADADAPAPTPPATLYDVFERIRDDERAHWSNLVSLVQFESLEAAGPATPTRACAPEDDACLAATDECAVAYAR
mmetsp:Transcript_13051/g.39020  ORF Transcript_13051/g.39020 Transcript_13051/m.39020 type:complete len:298 (-) Transcript_13051:101-994(-)